MYCQTELLLFMSPVGKYGFLLELLILNLLLHFLKIMLIDTIKWNPNHSHFAIFMKILALEKGQPGRKPKT